MTHIKPLSAELQKIANEEFNEVPSRISKDLHKLKLRIQRQPHLKARLDDQFLVQFLRFCKYNLEQATEKLDYFYTFKSLYPDISNAVDVDSVKFRRIHNMG